MYQLTQLADDLNHQRRHAHLAGQHHARRAHPSGQATRHSGHARQFMLRAAHSSRRLRAQPHAETTYVQ
jgi:hypothetical protein